jgi:predicted outer membrane repeat protein
MRIFFISIFLGFCILSGLNADTLDVPSEYATIQGAIDAAVNGDTILVQPDTYAESINFSGKNITVASLYLIDGDTSYVSQTVIDAGFMDRVVTFENGEDSTAILVGFTLINGFNFPGGGGGISCKNNSNPTLKYLKITGNIAENGGGIHCFNNANPSLSYVMIYFNEAFTSGGGLFCEKNSSPLLQNVIIQDNISQQDGGGLYNSDSCFTQLSNVIIADNRSIANGGGIYCETNSDLTLDSVRIEDNFAEEYGGGMYCSESSPLLRNVIFDGDSASQGGGIFFEISTTPSLENVRIVNNKSYTDGAGLYLLDSEISLKSSFIYGNRALGSGGGVYLAFSDLIFDAVDLSSIYLNHAAFSGNDLYNEDGEIIDVILDTFTVIIPTEYETYPVANYTFSISNGKVLQAANNLYVDANDGDNTNSGLSVSQPLKTITYALTKILADSLNPYTIYLDPGLYSSSSNGEIYPLNMKDFVSLKKVEFDSIHTGDTTEVILYAEQNSNIMTFDEDQGINLNRLVLTGASADLGGAIFCQKSDPVLTNLTITNNSSSNGGAIYASNSHPIVVNSILWNNVPQEVYFESIGDTSSIVVEHCDIQGGLATIETNSNGKVFWLDGNQDADPLFSDPSGFDFSLSYPNSPCMDAGTASFERDGITIVDLYLNTGFSGSNPEIGAHERFDPLSLGIYDTKSLPISYNLYQNHPNPFNPKTIITFSLPKPENVKIEIFNTLGQKVVVLLDKAMKTGLHEITFDASAYASGLYFYSIEAGNFHQVKRMTLIK